MLLIQFDIHNESYFMGSQQITLVAHTAVGRRGYALQRKPCGSRWIEEVQPKLWLCGHIHEDNSAGFIGNILVLNCACEYQNDILQGWSGDLETMQYEKITL